MLAATKQFRSESVYVMDIIKLVAMVERRNTPNQRGEMRKERLCHCAA